MFTNEGIPQEGRRHNFSVIALIQKKEFHNEGFQQCSRGWAALGASMPSSVFHRAKKGSNDSRTQVMTKVLDWIRYLIQRDLERGEVTFTWFVIESPDGILKRKHGQDQSLGEVIQKDFCVAISQI